MAFFGNKVSIRPYFLSNFCVYAIASPYCHCFRKHLIVPLECCRFLFLYILFSVASRATATVFDHTVLIDFVRASHLCAISHLHLKIDSVGGKNFVLCTNSLSSHHFNLSRCFLFHGWCARVCG